MKVVGELSLDGVRTQFTRAPGQLDFEVPYVTVQDGGWSERA
jgi:hypothetical protein